MVGRFCGSEPLVPTTTPTTTATTTTAATPPITPQNQPFLCTGRSSRCAFSTGLGGSAARGGSAVVAGAAAGGGGSSDGGVPPSRSEGRGIGLVGGADEERRSTSSACSRFCMCFCTSTRLGAVGFICRYFL